MIAWNRRSLLVNTLQKLTDRSPAETVIAEIRQATARTRSAEGIEKCLMRNLGYHLQEAIHVQVGPHKTVLRSEETALEVKT